MDIKLPISSRRKALCVVDIQPQTLVEKAKELIPQMVQFIEQVPYQTYVEANYYADEGSMFWKQNRFVKSESEAGPTAATIRQAIAATGHPHFFVQKTTRSLFKAPNTPELLTFLKSHQIEELHFIGYDINDCVLASAFDSIDLGYFTYVIEELSHHWGAIDELRDAAILIYRRQNMSNHSAHDFQE